MQTSNDTTHKIHLGGETPSPNLNLGQSVDQQILQTIASNHSARTVRTKFIQLVLSQAGIVGSCYLSKGLDEQWSPSLDHPSVGRLPKPEDFNEAFSQACDEFTQSPNVQTSQIGESGLFAAVAPIRTRTSQTEILLAATTSQAEAATAARTMQRVASALRLWINSQSAADSDWQVLALGAVIEMVSKIEKESTIKAAAEETANLLAGRIGCDSVAVGTMHQGRMRMHAISGVTKIDHSSTSSQNYLQSLIESVTRKEPGLFPATTADNNHLLQAHKQLAACTHSESVFSQPLANEDGDMTGALVMTGQGSLLRSSQVQRFCATAAPSISNAFDAVGKMHVGPFRRTMISVRERVSPLKRYLIVGGLLCSTLLLLIPITYRVRCNCVVEPLTRRFAVAPFAGQILFGHKEAGDFVSAGDVLAEMDGRAIRWELSGVTAERQQSLRTREIELSERNIPKTILAELEYDRLVSEEAVLQHRRDHLQIKSPIDGVVLSGSLERSEAASVETGMVLFEIGPLKPMRIEIAVPDDEIAQVKNDFPVKVWIDGQEDLPIEGVVKKIHPRSETRDADNVFIAEIEFANEDGRLRPGMQGSARIDCETRSLGWSLFHKPMNYVRSRLTWW